MNQPAFAAKQSPVNMGTKLPFGGKGGPKKSVIASMATNGLPQRDGAAFTIVMAD